MPNAVAQNKNTTLAADTITGRSAGSVTVRSTCQGEAPSAAAASSRRRSTPSQKDPTVRTTTARLKNTIAAMIAAGVPSRWSAPSGPDGDKRVRNATPTTTVGITNGTRTTARSIPRPGNRSRWSTNVTGSPSPTVSSVARLEDHNVNHSTRCNRPRPRTSRTPSGSNCPSGKKPLATMPATGTTKKTSSASRGRAASAARALPVRSRLLSTGSPGGDVSPPLQPAVAVTGDLRRGDGERVRRGPREVRPRRRKRDARVHGEHVHVVRQRLLEAPLRHEVYERLGALRGLGPFEDPGVLDRSEAAVEQAARRRVTATLGNGERRGGRVRQHDRTVALPSAAREVDLVGVGPAGGQLGPVRHQPLPVLRPPGAVLRDGREQERQPG